MVTKKNDHVMDYIKNIVFIFRLKISRLGFSKFFMIVLVNYYYFFKFKFQNNKKKKKKKMKKERKKDVSSIHRMLRVKSQ
jgi:hypothetical protein